MSSTGPYTIGAFDTSGKPDLITVGLAAETAHSCLNEAQERQRAGVDLSKARQSDLIGNVDCEFRPVDPKWLKHLMNWANWYYGRTDYPVLQAVYPDLENRFPEDEGFNRRFAQPLMQPGATTGPGRDRFLELGRQCGQVSPAGSFPTRGIRARIFPKLSTRETEPSRTSHTTPTTARGSSLATACRRAAQCSSASITR